MVHDILEQLIITRFYGGRRFTVVFIQVRHWALSRVSSIQTTQAVSQNMSNYGNS